MKPLKMFEVVMFALFLGCAFTIAANSEEENGALVYMKSFNEENSKMSNKLVLAEWNYASNITDENLKDKLKVSGEYAKWLKVKWQETQKYNWTTFKNENLKRQFKKYSLLGTAALSDDKHRELEEIISKMMQIYGKGTICSYKDPNKCDLSLEPHLTDILAKSRDEGELKHVWLRWRDASGKKCRQLFERYVELSNEAAVLNKFKNNAEYWLDDFEDPLFQENVESLWKQLQPLYLQLHAYVRNRLRAFYGEYVVPKEGAIPAHLLGNMWSQSWGNIIDITIPYKTVKSLDVTDELIKQNYTALKLFQMSEDFFTSLNMSKMTDEFWKNSIIEKPTDREMVCHASAWDFYDGKDFRIKMCTKVDVEDLNTVHHEMGHIQYYLQYKDQPRVFKEGANSGFHEAVGDVIALSVGTPAHLKTVGLLDQDYESSKEAVINQLFYTALEKIAFLPFGYLVDKYRWDIFQGTINPKDYNKEWWKLRYTYQGIEPPEQRTEEDFDAGAKYHVIADVPYIRYFVSFVIQFQFHKALCEKAGQYVPDNPEHKPFHDCDIYKSNEAGNLLSEMLQMGSSKPWPDAMEKITGQRKMDARPLLEYFSPLTSWLIEENKKSGESIGWKRV